MAPIQRDILRFATFVRQALARIDYLGKGDILAGLCTPFVPVLGFRVVKMVLEDRREPKEFGPHPGITLPKFASIASPSS
jgi:hypothetical protein